MTSRRMHNNNKNKNKPNVKIIKMASILASAFVLNFGGLLQINIAYAEKADRLKPIQVEANQAIYDDLKQVYQLKGRVILNKGSIQIKTEQADVLITPEGYQKAAATGGEGGKAFVRQKREGLNEFFEGFAQRIDYDSQSDIIVLTGQARLLRLDAKNQVLDEVNAEQMVYNGRNETYQAIAGAQTGRVTATISPKIKAGK